MNAKNSLEATPILSFSSNTNFWVVRAEGGKYYNDFIDNNYIGIRYNKVTIADLEKLKESDEITSEDTVKELYRKMYDPKGTKKMDRSAKQRLTQHARQTYLFTFNMQSGDVVFVPSKRSEYFAVGFIDGDPYDENTDYIKRRREDAPANGLHFAISDYVKRRKICWISTIKRDELPSFLSWTVNAHQAIMSINFENSGQKTRLMGIVFPLFEFEGKSYLRVHTAKRNSLSLKDWSYLTNSISEPESIDLKANINSPGFFTFAVTNIDWNLIIEIIRSLWNDASNFHSVIEIGGLLYLITGKDFKKMGPIRWCQSVYSSHLDIKLKKLEIKEKEDSIANKLNLSIKQSGTAIQNEHKRTSSNNGASHHNGKQANLKDK